MDFPAKNPERCEPPHGMLSALGLETAEVFGTDDYIVLVEDEAQVAASHQTSHGSRACLNAGLR